VIGSDDRNCFNDTAYVDIKVYAVPTIEISNGRAISLSTGGSVKLLTKSSPDVTKWLWTPSRGLSCTDCASPIASPKENLVYTVQASNDGSCTAKDEIMITSICNNSNVYVPNTFSPNGDGMNDSFYPRGTGIYTIKNFKVFTRWGQLLYERKNFEANNAAQGWDGTSGGKKMGPDVYVYLMEVLCENNVVFPLKGNITLIQ
jgi:gliding motility-associated-like protein